MLTFSRKVPPKDKVARWAKAPAVVAVETSAGLPQAKVPQRGNSSNSARGPLGSRAFNLLAQSILASIPKGAMSCSVFLFDVVPLPHIVWLNMRSWT